MDASLTATCTGPSLQVRPINRTAEGNPATPPITEPSLPSSPSEITSDGEILVVDDNEAVREMLADLIEGSGFRTIQAGDAAAALTILRNNNNIAALVTDLSMPGEDGICLIRLAREILPGLPAILLTGYAEEASSVGTTTGGNFHVLRKPVDCNSLIEQISLQIAQVHPA
jgi:DNA-binding NtrC family response regulator